MRPRFVAQVPRIGESCCAAAGGTAVFTADVASTIDAAKASIAGMYSWLLKMAAAPDCGRTGIGAKDNS